MRALLLLPLMITACPPVGDVGPIHVAIALEPGDATCDDDELIDSIDAIRIFANGAASACISIATVDDVAELESALKEQGVELAPVEEEAGTLFVIGYDSDGCDAADEDMCGRADYTLPVDTITVPLFCAGDTPSQAVTDCFDAAP
jgi:hypothetical protein